MTQVYDIKRSHTEETNEQNNNFREDQSDAIYFIDVDSIQRTETYKIFEGVKPNKISCLQNLVQQSRFVEHIWLSKSERMRSLQILRYCLLQLETHKDRDVRELSWLAPKMKNLDLDLKHFLGLFLPIERKYSRGLRDDEFIITDTDGQNTEKITKKIPLFLILDNLRSAFNVGAIFRTADCVGVSHLFLCGYTATPETPLIQKTTMGAHGNMSWSHHQNIGDVITELESKKTPIIALETVTGSQIIYKFEFPKTGCALLLGNERFGLEATLLKRCTSIVHIPCHGSKNSLNVAVTTGIAAYEVLRQWTQT